MEAEKCKEWKTEDLLDLCDEKINRLSIKNSLRFIKWGFKGRYNEIINFIFKCNEDKFAEGIGDKFLNNKKVFLEICDNRIERLKTSTREIVAVLGAAIAVTFAVLIQYNKTWVIIALLIILVVLILGIAFQRAQTNAWHAVKEAALRMMKENKKE